MAHRLFVMVTQNEPDLNRIVGSHLRLRRRDLQAAGSRPDLGSYSGDGQCPLVLFGHANTNSFVRDWQDRDRVTRYVDGDTVARQLQQCNLQTSTFPFCFIAVAIRYPPTGALPSGTTWPATCSGAA